MRGIVATSNISLPSCARRGYQNDFAGINNSISNAALVRCWPGTPEQWPEHSARYRGSGDLARIPQIRQYYALAELTEAERSFNAEGSAIAKGLGLVLWLKPDCAKLGPNRPVIQ